MSPSRLFPKGKKHSIHGVMKDSLLEHILFSSHQWGRQVNYGCSCWAQRIHRADNSAGGETNEWPALTTRDRQKLCLMIEAAR